MLCQLPTLSGLPGTILGDGNIRFGLPSNQSVEGRKIQSDKVAERWWLKPLSLSRSNPWNGRDHVCHAIVVLRNDNKGKDLGAELRISESLMNPNFVQNRD